MAKKKTAAKTTSKQKTPKSKSAKKKNSQTKSGKKKWSHKVKTVSTFPPEGVFTKDVKTIAKSLGSKKVSPKGIGSGIRMIQFFINRAGKNLLKSQERELEKAKHTLQERSQREQTKANQTK